MYILKKKIFFLKCNLECLSSLLECLSLFPHSVIVLTPELNFFSPQSHLLMCDLVCIDCPNCCGHSCQRKDLNPHIAMCSNKPEQCPTCSIHFTRDKVQLHLPQCSSIVLPESILSNLFKVRGLNCWNSSLRKPLK